MTWRFIGLSLLLLPATHVFAAPLYGDVDGNGRLDYRDAAILLRVASGLRPNTEAVKRTGDVAPVNDYNRGSFGDGKINLADALRLVRKANGLSTASWPARETLYPLEAGNHITVRKYDASGAAVTGPDLDVPDPVLSISGPVVDEFGGVQVPGVYVVAGPTGGDDHLLQVQDTNGAPSSLNATQLNFGGNTTRFNPPLVLVQYPLQNGASWFGMTTVTDVMSGLQWPATYAGSLQGPVTVTLGDSTHAFDNAWKLTLTYSTPLAGPSGTEYYWFVPFLGPVQHGYSRTVFMQTTTVNPDYKLVKADIHGVHYP